MEFDDAYQALTDHADDARWAYGTGFADPLADVPTELPDGVDPADLAAYCLMLGDDALILSHRLQEWVTRAPELEDELALANIGLDLLGQARLLLTRAGQAGSHGLPAAGLVAAGPPAAGPIAAGPHVDEDDLAFGREAAEFRNVRLAERADADFAHLVARLLVLSTWRLAAFDRLTASRDPMLAAIAAKGVKEITYHRDYAAQWVVRLGDGTAVSHQRMAAATAALGPVLGELFAVHPVEKRLIEAGIAVDPAALRDECDAVLGQVLAAATLEPLAGSAGAGSPLGRDGSHTAALDEILTEMQSVARATAGGVW